MVTLLFCQLFPQMPQHNAAAKLGLADCGGLVVRITHLAQPRRDHNQAVATIAAAAFIHWPSIVAELSESVVAYRTDSQKPPPRTFCGFIHRFTNAQGANAAVARNRFDGSPATLYDFWLRRPRNGV